MKLRNPRMAAARCRSLKDPAASDMEVSGRRAAEQGRRIGKTCRACRGKLPTSSEAELQKRLCSVDGDGYPTRNTIFEDTQVAVPYQDRAEAGEFALADPVAVADLVNSFFSTTNPTSASFSAPWKSSKAASPISPNPCATTLRRFAELIRLCSRKVTTHRKRGMGVPSPLVLCCVLHMVDNHDFNWSLTRFQPKSKLVLYGCKDRWAKASGVVGRPFELEVVGSREPCSIPHGTPRRTGEGVGETRHGPLLERHMKHRLPVRVSGYIGLLVVPCRLEFRPVLAYDQRVSRKLLCFPVKRQLEAIG